MTDLRKTVAIVGVDESDEIGKIPNKGGKHVTKSFGPKPSRSPISPGMNRGSARNR